MIPRPLIGEPLAVDLLNTRWRAAGSEVDLLDTAAGFEQWLAESGQQDVAPTGAARDAVRQARDAIRAMVASGDDAPDAAAENAVNGILTRGMTVRRIEDGQLREHTLMTAPEWTAAWRAAANYAELRSAAPSAIRQCQHPECVLYFYDPTGRRRWCSMAGCGNRAKAKRHYARRAEQLDTASAEKLRHLR